MYAIFYNITAAHSRKHAHTHNNIRYIARPKNSIVLCIIALLVATHNITSVLKFFEITRVRRRFKCIDVNRTDTLSRTQWVYKKTACDDRRGWKTHGQLIVCSVTRVADKTRINYFIICTNCEPRF